MCMYIHCVALCVMCAPVRLWPFREVVFLVGLTKEILVMNMPSCLQCNSSSTRQCPYHVAKHSIAHFSLSVTLSLVKVMLVHMLYCIPCKSCILCALGPARNASTQWLLGYRSHDEVSLSSLLLSHERAGGWGGGRLPPGHREVHRGHHSGPQ